MQTELCDLREQRNTVDHEMIECVERRDNEVKLAEQIPLRSAVNTVYGMMYSMEENKKIGHVYLVGAGCGKGLITLRGLELIRKADAIVYDDLIDGTLTDSAPADCRLIYMGKRGGRKSANQQEINEMLAALASSGLMVVRLKGGDPFVFGRGGEEYQYLNARGIPCTAVPGVSSCIAVPEEAGIPVTHRGSAGSFTVVTGHSADGNSQDYRTLAAVGGTLIFLMGLRSCREVTGQLMQYGKDPDTPAAVISRGCSSDERRINGTLSNIAERASAAETPAVLVIGKNAAFAFSDREEGPDETIGPLSGKTAAVLGTPAFTDKVRKKLAGLGCRVKACPILSVREREIRLPDFQQYSYIVFTSSNGIRIFFHMMQAQERDIRELMHAKFAVIGSATAQTLYSYSIRADLVPADFTSRALAEKLAEDIGDDVNARILILRAADGSKDLNRILDAHHIAYDDEAVYETVVDAGEMPGGREFSYVIFGSSGSVSAFFQDQDPGEDYGRTRFVCIGEVSAQTLRKMSRADMIVADTYTVDGIVSAVIRDAQAERKGTGKEE